VTAYRLTAVPPVVVSDWADASERVLGKHCDRRSKRPRTEQRRGHLGEYMAAEMFPPRTQRRPDLGRDIVELGGSAEIHING
jgi:hypothetical protein